jgi:serine/threonine protein kinase
LPSKTLDLLVRMLEKDPHKRISADGALNHAYFQSEMEVELPVQKERPVLREVFSPSAARKEVMTPTSASHKPLMFDTGRRQDVRPYFYS